MFVGIAGGIVPLTRQSRESSKCYCYWLSNVEFFVNSNNTYKNKTTL